MQARQGTERAPVNQLEGAIDVSNVQTEYKPDQRPPGPRIERTHQTVLAPDSIADHQVVVLARRQERGDLGEVELAVAVDEADQLVAAIVEARADGAAIAAVGGMVDHPNE